MGGKGKNLIADMPLDVEEYNLRVVSIKQRRNNEILSYNALTAEQQASEAVRHEENMRRFDEEEEELKNEYPYLVDIYAINEEIVDGEYIIPGKLVLYVEDSAGNAVVIGEVDGETISFDMLTQKYDLGTVTTGI